MIRRWRTAWRLGFTGLLFTGLRFSRVRFNRLCIGSGRPVCGRVACSSGLRRQTIRSCRRRSLSAWLCSRAGGSYAGSGRQRDLTDWLRSAFENHFRDASNRAIDQNLVARIQALDNLHQAVAATPGFDDLFLGRSVDDLPDFLRSGKFDQ